MDADERGWAEERERRAKSATFWSAAMERKRIRRFRARGELMRWMNVRPACESGGGLAPTTALQNAGARFGKSRANTPTVTYTRGNDLSGSLEGA
jgi:hypothetical protein